MSGGFTMTGRAHRGWRGHGGGAAGGRGGGAAHLPPADDAAAWLAGRLPDGWFTGAPDVTVDGEEIIIVGELPPLEEEPADDAARAAAESGRISRFREQTRDQRIEI